MEVTIIGGGIAGLTTALALDKAGIRCQIFESVNELRELGVGINLLPHAVSKLAELDLLDGLYRLAIETSELCYFNKFGQLIWQEPRGRAAEATCGPGGASPGRSAGKKRASYSARQPCRRACRAHRSDVPASPALFLA